MSFDESVVMNYPHIGTLSNFLRITSMLLYALGTISTYGDSCLGVKFKIVLILRINWPTDGHNRWTFFAYYPHFMLLLHKLTFKPSGIARFDPTLRPINLVHNKFGYNNFGYHNFSHKFRNHLVYNNFSQFFWLLETIFTSIFLFDFTSFSYLRG